MTVPQVTTYRCVIGEISSLPNELTYLQPISSRRRGVWVGFCKGDKKHSEHIIAIKKSKKWTLLNSLSDVFTKPDGTKFGKRLFDREKELRCPDGKVYMRLQKKLTNELNINHVDLYRCKGNTKGKGHKPHIVRIHHGVLEVEINKKSVGVLIVTIESD